MAIFGVLINRQLICKLNKGFRFLLCVIDFFSKYALVVPLKDKKGLSIVDAFQKILNDSANRRSQSKERKVSKIWVHEGREFYYNSFKN